MNLKQEILYLLNAWESGGDSSEYYREISTLVDKLNDYNSSSLVVRLRTGSDQEAWFADILDAVNISSIQIK